ncbi:MAG: CBS domain-containing protein [Actinomycetota bacterium]
MAGKARDIMTGSPECLKQNDSITDAAKKLSKLSVGSMPICGDDNRLKGMVTDRDIVVKVLAEDQDPSSVKVIELAQGKPVTIGADDSIGEVIKTMADHQVRRLPVIDGHDLVGIISTADVARNVSDDAEKGQLLEFISMP